MCGHSAKGGSLVPKKGGLRSGYNQKKGVLDLGASTTQKRGNLELVL